MHVCVGVCVHAYLNASVSVPRCRPLLSWPQTSLRQPPIPPPPPAHEEMGREHSSDVGKGQEEMRESEGGKENKKGTIEGEGLDSCLLPSLEASSSQS